VSFTRRGAITLLALACTAALAQEPVDQPAEPAEQAPEQVLATVDGEPITVADLWWFTEQMAGGRLLDDMILWRLVTAEAEAVGVKVGTPEVDEAVEQLKAGHASETEFEQWLHDRGQTLKGLRMQLQQDLLVDKLLRQRIGLTEEGIREYYEEHPEEFTQPPRVHLLDIVTLSADDAFAARERLAAGEDFGEVAREMSVDPTAEEGGDRGWIVPDDVLVPKVADVVFAMEEGEVSDPLCCEDHYHVFFARETEPGRLIDFEEARPQVTERIRERRGISKELLLTLLRRRAEISVAWDEHSYLNDVYARLREIGVVVDHEPIDLPRPAELLPSGHLLVPAEAVLAAIGAEVSWDAEEGVLDAARDGVRIRLTEGSSVLVAGNEEREMKEPPQVRDEVLMVSPRVPVEALGGTLLWNRQENTLYIDSHGDEERTEEAAGGAEG